MKWDIDKRTAEIGAKSRMMNGIKTRYYMEYVLFKKSECV